MMALRLNLALGLALSVSSTVALRVTLFRSSPALAGQYTHLRKPQVSFSRHSIQAAHLPAGGVSTPDPSGASLLLALTIALEVIATTCMKMTMKSNLWYCGVALGYGLCFTVFPLVLRRMPLATAYAIWSGAGTIATALVSAAFFGETLSVPKAACIFLIVAGVVGLNLIGAGH